MTALLPDRETRGETKRSAAEVRHDLRHRGRWCWWPASPGSWPRPAP